MTTNLWPLVVGGAARFAVAWLSVTSPQQLDGGSWDALVVGSRQSRSALLERGFRRSRGIPEQPGLATATPTMAELLLLALQPLAGHNNVMLLAVGIVSQFGVYMLLPRRAALLYWLNPILVVSAVLSPLPSLNHLILASLWNLFSVRRGWDTFESMFTHFRRRRAAFTPLRNRSLGPPCISEFEGLMQIP